MTTAHLLSGHGKAVPKAAAIGDNGHLFFQGDPMNKLHHVLVSAALVCAVSGVAAQTMKPGLWEITNKMSSDSAAMNKEMAAMQKEMANMPADQRKMMESMMAKQGVGMGAGGAMTAKVCLTQEMVERNEVGAQQGDCQHTRSARSGNTMKFSFVCAKPPSSGEGEVTFVSPQAYTMKMMVSNGAKGKTEKMNMDASGKFLSADCGTVKPIMPPKK